MEKLLQNFKHLFEDELYNSVIPFWQKYSIDKKNGGYYNCLDKEGRVYDTTKYMWLHGRQIWLFSKLYNTVDRNKEWLNIAKHGVEFMNKFALTSNNRVFFSLNNSGQPVYMQRKIFTECFYTIALAEYSKAATNEKLYKKAKQMFDFVWKLSIDRGLVGRETLEGEADFQTLSVPMILLNVIEETFQGDYSVVLDKVYICIDSLKKHFVNGIVYENVLKDGKLHDSSNGRLLNPGHAIEAGWFLKHWGILLNNNNLKNLGTDIIRSSFIKGWDNEYGGLFYFLDAGGNSPVQLEWNMKLWWPHTEALYAFLLIYLETNYTKDWDTFIKIKDYAFSNFSDPENGEWFGYLDRYGNKSLNFKGGPYKGCFHVPRSLYLCIKALDNINQ